MEQSFKVLSIDFDYFQNVSRLDLDFYPPGYDLTTSESEKAWFECYKRHKKPLLKTNVNHSLFNTMLSILNNQPSTIPVLITNSHKDAYSFIKQHIKNDYLGLVNVDMHHDIINQNPNLDCGNWIGHVLKEFKTDFRWITRKVSMDAYQIKDTEKSLFHMELGLSSILNEKFDAVFICRSDTWTPPHLDTCFDEMKNACLAHFDTVDVEYDVFYPRDIDEIRLASVA